MDNAGSGPGPAKRVHDFGLLAVIIAIGLGGCVTRPGGSDVYPDHLDRLPSGARVEVTTRDGRQLRLRITEATATGLRGVDRHFRSYELAPEDIDELSVLPQNDWVVALAFFAVVFVTGF
jgi:hypothetical protein